MNLKSLFCLLFVCFGLLQSNAQQMRVSPEEDFDSGKRHIKVIGAIGDKTACLLENYEGFQILWYDSAMRKIATSKLEFLERGAERIFLALRKNVVQVFYQKKKRKDLTLWGANVILADKDTILPVLLDSFQLKGGWDKTRFQLFSENESGVIYAINEYDDDSKMLHYKSVLLSEDLVAKNKMEGSSAPMEYHHILDAKVDASGNGMHLVFAQPSRDYNTWLSVQIRSAVGTEMPKREAVDLDLKGSLLSSPKVAYDRAQNRLVIGGVLLNNSNNEQSLGRYVYDTKSQSVERQNISLDNAESLSALDLSKVQLRHMLLKTDGGVSFILEKSYQEIQQRNRSFGIMAPGMMMGGGSYSVFHNDEIYAISTDKEGQVEWQEVVAKNQEASEKGNPFHSFGLLNSSLGNVFVFKDFENNSKRFITAFLSSKGMLTVRQYATAVYPSLEEDKVLLRGAKQISANEFVFPIIKRGGLSFAKILF